VGVTNNTRPSQPIASDSSFDYRLPDEAPHPVQQTNQTVQD